MAVALLFDKAKPVQNRKGIASETVTKKHDKSVLWQSSSHQSNCFRTPSISSDEYTEVDTCANRFLTTETQT